MNLLSIFMEEKTEAEKKIKQIENLLKKNNISDDYIIKGFHEFFSAKSKEATQRSQYAKSKEKNLIDDFMGTSE